jgi:hypothetical protein
MKAVQFIFFFFYFQKNLDTELHFWSVCYQKDGMFDLWRETSLKIKPDFGDKCDLVPELIQFCWETKVTYDLFCVYICNNTNSAAKIVYFRRINKNYCGS